MNILYVSPYVPDVSRGRTFHLIRLLAEAGHAVTIAALGMEHLEADRDSREVLETFCKAVFVTPFSPTDSLAHFAKYLTSAVPYYASSFFCPAFETSLAALVSEHDFDIVHVEQLRGAGLITSLIGRLPIVYDAVECATAAYSKSAQEQDLSAIGQTFFRKEHSKLAKYEPRLAARFVKTLVSTEGDADALRALAASQGLPSEIEVLPDGVDVNYYCPQPQVAIEGGNITLSGKTHYQANEDAALFFCREVLPALQQSFPTVTVTVIGKNLHGELAQMLPSSGAGIEAVDASEDIRLYLARASIVVCPILSGESTKSNLLESLAMGKPVVATPLCCRGVENAAAGKSYLLADTPMAFATQILHLICHPEESARLGASARKYAQGRHDWEKVTARLTEIYQEVIDQHAVSKTVESPL